MEHNAIRVLLVEDDPDDAFLLRDMLNEVAAAHFDLHHARRLSEALEMAAAEPFAVVLLDLTLPDSQGLDTFIEFHAAQPELPVVVLTGLNDENMAIKAVHGGAQDYLVKGQVSGHLLVRSLRYAIERQRTSYYRALLTERERFDAAVSQMSDGIVVTDGDWRLTNANRAASLLLNLALDTWHGRALDDILGRFGLSTPVEELRAATDRVTAFEIARADTHPPLYLDARLSRVFGADGQLVSTVLTLRDVTSERLARHVQANFLSAVPHKLRTPLSVLNGFLQLAKRLTPEQFIQEREHLMDVCQSELKSLTAIVDKLLDFEASGVRQLEEELRQTDVAAVTATVIAWARKRYEATALEVDLRVAPEAAKVACTNEHLAFTLGEFLDNALKFADKDPVRVTLAAERDGDWVRFTFSDNGPGIPHEYFDRIFEGFVQVEEFFTGQVPGLGIGLRLARQIVEAYGGTVSVASTIGEGTTFTFTLPAAG